MTGELLFLAAFVATGCRVRYVTLRSRRWLLDELEAESFIEAIRCPR